MTTASNANSPRPLDSPGEGWWRASDGNWYPPPAPRLRPSARVRRATTTVGVAAGTGMFGCMFGGNALMLCDDCSTAELATALGLFSYGYLASWFGVMLLHRGTRDAITTGGDARALRIVLAFVIGLTSMLWLGSAASGGHWVLSLTLGASLVIGILLGSTWPLPPAEASPQQSQLPTTTP